MAPCQLNSKDRHSATGLMARNKGQRVKEHTLVFCVTGISKPRRNIPNSADCVISLTGLRATLRTPSFKNGQYRAFSRRVREANCPEGKRGPSGALGAAQSDPQGGWEASRATGRELCDTGHPVLEDSP